MNAIQKLVIATAIYNADVTAIDIAEVIVIAIAIYNAEVIVIAIAIYNADVTAIATDVATVDATTLSNTVIITTTDIVTTIATAISI